jgi:hypothetical protein
MDTVMHVKFPNTQALRVVLPSEQWSVDLAPNLSTKEVTVVKCKNIQGAPEICIGFKNIRGTWEFVPGYTTRYVQLQGGGVRLSRGIRLCIDALHPNGVVTTC